MSNLLYPDVKRPYYIVAPPYVRTSAGVKALHLLCHSLNRMGHSAYVLIYPYMAWKNNQVEPDLLTPILNTHVAETHRKKGLTPIVVYPETVQGNPFNAPCVVRFVMNYPGLLGGDKTYAPEELIYAYSKTLGDAASTENVLFVPTTDTRIFYPPANENTRSGSCFTASKYKHLGHKLLPITDNSFEITRDLPGSLKTEEVADLFRRSEVFYTYENTALATEAVLCGCPAVFIPNPHLQGVIAKAELGMEGYAWGATDTEIAHARATVAQGRTNYLKSYDKYWKDLERFVALTQEHASGKPYPALMHVPGLIDSIVVSLKQFGFLGLARIAARKVFKILFGRK
jgi:hypothetical protein